MEPPYVVHHWVPFPLETGGLILDSADIPPRGATRCCGVWRVVDDCCCLSGSWCVDSGMRALSYLFVVLLLQDGGGGDDIGDDHHFPMN